MRPWNQLSSIPVITPSSIEPCPSSSSWANSSSARRSISSVSSSTYHDPPSGSATWATFVSLAITCWVRSAIRAARSVGSASASSIELVCSDWVPPSTPASASIAVRTMLTSGCVRRQRHPGGLGVEAQLHRTLVRRPVPLPHPPRPDPARGAVLGDLLEEVDVGVEEERQAEARTHRPPEPAPSANST